mgnify:CR=1 FL=1
MLIEPRHLRANIQDMFPPPKTVAFGKAVAGTTVDLGNKRKLLVKRIRQARSGRVPRPIGGVGQQRGLNHRVFSG